MMEAHDITKLFPKMDDKEYAALRLDIQLNKLQEPIWTFKGKIIDGWHRYRACLELNIKPQFREWTGEGSLETFIFSLNYHRRNLDASQRAFLALPIEERVAAEAKANMRTGGGDRKSFKAKSGSKKIQKPIHSAKVAAEIAGTNPSYVTAAKKVMESAPELREAVMKRTLKILHARDLSQYPAEKREAVVELIKNKKAKDYKEALRMVRTNELQAVADGLPEASSRYRLFHRAIEDITVADVPDEALSLILADPPYSKEYVEVYGHLARLAARTLKPLGNLLVMCGHGYLPEVLALMTAVPGLKYRWVCNYDMPGAAEKVEYFNVRSDWKPVLWFSKGEYDDSCPLDRYTSDKSEKLLHPWQQSESGILSIIKNHARPGDTVADFFLGSGTTAIAALKLNMYFVGSDSEEGCVNTTKGRIAEYLAQSQEDMALAA